MGPRLPYAGPSPGPVWNQKPSEDLFTIFISIRFFFPPGLCLPKKHTIGILLPQTCRVLRNEDVSPHRSCPAQLKGPDAPTFATGPRSRRAARPVIGATLSDGLRSVPTFRKVR